MIQVKDDVGLGQDGVWSWWKAVVVQIYFEGKADKI